MSYTAYRSQLETLIGEHESFAQQAAVETAESQTDLRRRLGEQGQRAEELRGEYEGLPEAVSSL